MAINKAKALAAADKHFAKQNYSKALNELLKVEKVSPKDINLLNRIGDIYSKLGKKSDAVKYFTKVADSHQRGGFNLKAIAVLKKMIRIDPSFMDARDRLVNLYMAQGHQSEARGELRRMAEHFHNENLFQRALACYEKLTKIDPGNLDARIKITELLLREGRRKDAAQHFVAMAKELLQKNMLNEAQKIVGRGLKVESENVDLLILLTRICLAEGKIDEALVKLTEICRKNENNLEALRLLGQTYLDRGQLRDARACFLRAMHISPDEVNALEDVAREFIKAGQLDDAYSSLAHVAESFINQGDFDEAIRLFRSILYVDENHLPSLDAMVNIYAKANQIANAVLNQEKIIHHYKTRGDQEKVIEAVARLLEIEPENQEWRARYEAMAGPSASEPVGEVPAEEKPEPGDRTDVHMFDVGDDFGGGEEEENLSPEERIPTLLKDAEMALKYGMIEQAEENLTAIKEIDHLHIVANEKLKQLHLERGHVDQAVGCLVCLVNAYIEQNNAAKARECVEEIRKHRPDIAEIHANRLEELLPGNAAQATAAEDVGFAFDSPVNPAEEVVFESGDQPDVVDFKDLSGPSQPEQESDPEGDSWSLDMPVAELEGNNDPDAPSEPDAFALDFGMDETGEVSVSDDSSKPSFSIESPEDDEAASLAFLDEHVIDEEEALAESLKIEEAPPEEPAPEEPAELAFMEDSQPSAEDLAMVDQDPPASSKPAADAESEALEEDLAFLDEEEPPSPADAQPEAEEDLAFLDEADPPPPAEAEEDLAFLDDAEPPPAAPEPEAQTKEDKLAFLDEEDATIDQSIGSTSISMSAHPDLDSLSGELEEIDFFISVEAFDDARNLINDALKRFNDHPLIMERLHEIEDKTQAADRRKLAMELSTTPEPGGDTVDDLLEGDGTGFFDLAAELNEELFDEDEAEIVNDAPQEEIQTVEELFQEFKKGVDEQIDAEDHQTHYDLGIAYKEMGLLEEAINEFKRAQVGKGRFLECVTMIGSCLVELGRGDDVVQLFNEAVENPNIEDQERMVCYYELGRAHENQGDTDSALTAFREVQKTDPGYRDLEERIEALV